MDRANSPEDKRSDATSPDQNIRLLAINLRGAAIAGTTPRGFCEVIDTSGKTGARRHDCGART
jgi:hypothetical protein